MVDRIEMLAALARLRRSMPRNADAMLVCEGAELWATSPAPDKLARDITPVETMASDITAECSECAKRRVKHAKAQARFRSKAKGKASG